VTVPFVNLSATSVDWEPLHANESENAFRWSNLVGDLPHNLYRVSTSSGVASRTGISAGCGVLESQKVCSNKCQSHRCGKS
jgi:hypothetical protein